MTRHQLQEVLAVAAEVKKVLGEEDITQIQSTFTRLDQAVKAVDMTLLTGHPHMVWMELSMKLTNNAVEGNSVTNLQEAQRVAALLENDIGSLRNQLGLYDVVIRPVLNEVFRDQLAEVYAEYFTLQQGLSGDDPEAAARAIEQMLSKLKNVDMTLISGAEHAFWMQVSNDLEKVLTDAAQTEDIKVQREHFYLLSQSLIKLAQRFGAGGTEVVYTMHCPMAFDNRGADWLQDNDQLLNPYFGAAMLRCGSITEVIAPATIR